MFLCKFNVPLRQQIPIKILSEFSVKNFLKLECSSFFEVNANFEFSNSSDFNPDCYFEKDKYHFVFEFKNVSKKSITVSNVQTSCGCTAAEKPSEPIKKGKKGVIKVTYDTKRVGAFTKTITVFSDGGDPVVLTIRGTVLSPADSPTTN